MLEIIWSGQNKNGKKWQVSIRTQLCSSTCVHYSFITENTTVFPVFRSFLSLLLCNMKYGAVQQASQISLICICFPAQSTPALMGPSPLSPSIVKATAHCLLLLIITVFILRKPILRHMNSSFYPTGKPIQSCINIKIRSDLKDATYLQHSPLK